MRGASGAGGQGRRVPFRLIRPASGQPTLHALDRQAACRVGSPARPLGAKGEPGHGGEALRVQGQPPDVPQAASRSQLARATAVVAVGMLASRALGFVRETSLAWFFGANSSADVYVIATTIPLVIFMAVGNAITNIFVPTYTGTLARRGAAEADREASNAAVVLTVFMLAITLAAWLGARWVVAAIAPGFGRSEAIEATLLTRVTIPTMLFLTWAAVAQAVLNSRQHFAVPAFQGVWQNTLTIIAIILGGLHWGVGFAVWGVLAGTSLTFLVQIPALRRAGFRFTWGFDLRNPSLRHMTRLAVPVLVSSMAQQVGVVFDRALASGLGTGIVAAINYAYRMEYLAYNILGLAISTVLYPSLASFAGLGDMARFKDALGRGIGLINFITAPIMLDLLLFRVPLIRVLFQHGRFNAQATSETAYALFFFALGTISIAWTDLLSKSFFALRDPGPPMIGGFGDVAVNLALMFALVGPLRQGGLALATSAGWTTAVVYMGWRMRRKVGPLGGGRIVRKFLRMCVAAVAAIVPLWLLFNLAVSRLHLDSTLHQGVALAIAGLGGSGLYLLITARLRVEEAGYVGEFARGVWRRLRPAA